MFIKVIKFKSSMEEEIKEEQIEEQEPWYKGPIRYIIMLFLILLLVLWVFPSYSIKLDPEPKKIPKIEEVFVKNYEINISSNRNIINKYDYIGLIKPNDPVVKHTADKIVSVSCAGGKICHAKALFYFVRNNFQYVSDPNTFEYVKDARESLVVKGGDCDDSSVLLVNLLESIGIHTRFVFIPGHVYVQAYLPEALKRYKTEGDWVNLDSTCWNCRFGEIPIKNLEKPKEYLDVP